MYEAGQLSKSKCSRVTWTVEALDGTHKGQDFRGTSDVG